MPLSRNALIFLLYLMGWMSFILLTGIDQSGFHYTDDFRLIKIQTQLESIGYWQTLKFWLLDDFSIRLRPGYYGWQVTEVFFLGVNFVKWQYFHALLAAVTSFCFFRFFAKLGFNLSLAFLFPFWAFLGKMTPLWYRLGANEPYALFFLSLSLLFFAYKKNAYFVLFAVLASLTKESFILLLPTLGLLYLGANWYLERDKKKWLLVTSLAVVMLVELFVILYWVGTDEICYAGMTNNSFRRYFEVHSSLAHASYGPFIAIIWGALLLIQRVFDYKQLLWIFLLFVSVVAGQVLLHAQSGIYERYLLPGTLAYAFLLLLGAELLYKWGTTLEAKKKKILLLILGLLLSYNLFDRVKPLMNSAREYVSGGKLMQFHRKMVEEHTKTHSPILLAIDILQAEYATAVDVYFANILKRRNVFLEHIPHFEIPAERLRCETLVQQEALTKWDRQGQLWTTINGAPFKKFDLIIAYNDPSFLAKFKERHQDWFKSELYDYADHQYLRFYYLK